jgi:hypothetical protein
MSRPDFHISYKISSQMAEGLSALHSGGPCPTPQKDSWYSFVLEADQSHSAAGGIR